MKKPFVTKEKLEEIIKTYPTPFHLYDEKGIRENAKELYDAFSWNKGYKEFFAVKATPNPFLINILHEYGCGCDCSSMTELMLSEALGITGHDIMFSSNDTPEAEFKKAADIGAIINLDDITHIEKVEHAVGYLPKTMSCRSDSRSVLASSLYQPALRNRQDSVCTLTRWGKSSVRLRSSALIINCRKGNAMIKIACLGFAGMLLAGLLKHSHSPYAELISLAASLLIIFCTLTKLASVFEMLERLRGYVSMQEGYFRILLKIIGITYVADFSSSICLDAGYKAIAGQIEVFGKISVLAVSSPIILALLDLISAML